MSSGVYAIRGRPLDVLRAGPPRPAPGSPPQTSPAAALLDDLGDHPRAHRAPALADGEAQPLVHGDRLDQLDRHLDVVARHDHLRPLGEVRHPGHVGRAEVELRPVAVEERGVAAALLLLQAVDLGLELRVRRDRARLAEHLSALDVLALEPAQQAADVVPGLALVEDLAEHLDAGDDGLRRLRTDADDLDLVARVDDALLDDLLLVLLVALEGLERGALDERDVVARELVLVQEVADLDLDELEQLVVVD